MCIDYNLFKRIKEKESLLSRDDFLKFKVEILLKLQLHYEIALISSILIFIGIIGIPLHGNLFNLFNNLKYFNDIFYGLVIGSLLVAFGLIVFFYKKIRATRRDVWEFYEKYLDELRNLRQLRKQEL